MQKSTGFWDVVFWIATVQFIRCFFLKMRIVPNILSWGFVLALTFFSPTIVTAASTDPIVYVFSQTTCGHCQDELEFLKTELPAVQVVKMEIHSDAKYRELFENVTKKFGLQQATPVTVVGNTVIGGFGDGSQIIKVLENAKGFLSPEELMNDPCAHAYAGPVLDSNACAQIPLTASQTGSGTQTGGICDDGTVCAPGGGFVDPLDGVGAIPFIGKITRSDYSLPVLSGILGIIDGFNPCAMWVLVIFLIALIQIGDRTKMLLVAGTFLLAEAIMYTLILTLWINAFEFLKWTWVTPLVGLVAVGAGLFFLYEGIFTDGTCKVTNVQQRRVISEKIKNIAHNPLSWGMFVAILGLAFSVNIIEFACSAGIPQAFTLILSQSALNTLETVAMIAIYITGYMVDDFIVFGIALYSIEKIGITHKFSKATNIIGGILMVILGLLLVISPETLSFSG